jgi:hypothetical protein
MVREPAGIDRTHPFGSPKPGGDCNALALVDQKPHRAALSAVIGNGVGQPARN